MSSDTDQDLPQLTAKKLIRARELANKGRTVAASRLYEEIIRFDPRGGYAWLEFGDTLTDLMRFSDALNAYKKALEFAPDNRKGFVFARTGILLEQSAEFAQAGHNFELAVKSFDEPVAWVWVLYGKNLFIRGKYDEAEGLLLNASRLESNECGEALLNLALLYRAVERYDDAGRMVSKLLDIEPRNKDAKKILASLN